MISFTLTFCLIIYGTILKVSIKIEDKLDYEFVTINNEELVVLSEYKGDILAVPYEIEKDGTYVFNTETYQLYDRTKGIYEYKNLDNPPEIKGH